MPISSVSISVCLRVSVCLPVTSNRLTTCLPVTSNNTAEHIHRHSLEGSDCNVKYLPYTTLHYTQYLVSLYLTRSRDKHQISYRARLPQGHDPTPIGDVYGVSACPAPSRWQGLTAPALESRIPRCSRAVASSTTDLFVSRFEYRNQRQQDTVLHVVAYSGT